MGLSITLSLGGVDFCLSPSENSSSLPLKGHADAAPIASVRLLSAAGSPSSASASVTGSVSSDLEGFTAELASFTGTLRVSLSAGIADPSSSTTKTIPTLPTASKAAADSDLSIEETCITLEPSVLGESNRVRDVDDGVGRGDANNDFYCSATSRQTQSHRSEDAGAAYLAKDEAQSSSRHRGVPVKFQQCEPQVQSQREDDSSRESGDGSHLPSDVDEVDPSDEEDEVGLVDSVESPFLDEGSGSVSRSTLEIRDGSDVNKSHCRSGDSPADARQKPAVWNEVLTSEPSRRGFGMVRSKGQSDLIGSLPFQKLLSERWVDPDIPPPSLSLFSERDRPFRRIAIAKVIAHRKWMQEHHLNDEQDSTPEANIDALATIAQGRESMVPKPGTISSTTALHQACANPDITLESLRLALEADPDAASVPDEKGKLPIHVIAENEALLEYPQRRDDVGTFIRDLLDVYPEGMIEADGEGNTPLAPIIWRWIENTYLAADEERSKAVSALGSTLLSPSHAFTKLGFGRDYRERGGIDDDGIDSGGGRCSSDIQTSSKLIETDKYDDLFPDVFAPPIVEWALFMLSLALDNFSGPLGHERGTRLEQLSSRGILAERIASIPLFLKTLLLIEDDETRARILELSIVRRVMLRATSVNYWLVQLLQKSGTPSRRTVSYFLIVSELDISDFIGKERGPKAADFEAFNKEKRALFEAVRNYREILPSLLILPKKQLEHISRSRLVWQVLDDTISRKFIISIVVIDFVLHLTLLIAFRVTLQAQDYVSEMQKTEPPSTVELVSILCCHQLVRIVSEGSHLLSISPSVFRSFLSDAWTWVDTASIALVWTSTVQLSSDQPKPDSFQLAVSMALLWLRLLGLLKAMNMHLATYILSVIEIVKDIRWYLVLLGCMLFMFADMIHILTSYSDGGSYCKVDFDEEETRVREDFCSEDILPSYFRMYGVLVGDFDIDDYRVIPLIATLFALFTFIGVILLLNVLIAIVSDSYEKSRIRSAFLFGRARVSFAAEHVALESFLVDPTNRDASSCCAIRFLKLAGRWMVFISMLASAVVVDAFIYFFIIEQFKEERAGEHVFFVILMFVFALILNWAIFDVFRFVIRSRLPGSKSCPCKMNSSVQSVWKKAKSCLSYPITVFAPFLPRRLFGVTHLWHAESEDNDNGETDDWDGRMSYLEKQTSSIVRESEHRIQEKVKESERRIRQYEHTVKTELQKDISDIMSIVSPGGSS